MSLVSTYVYIGYGEFLENPVITFPEGFICFDDDEPPEIVIKKRNARTEKAALERAHGVLRRLGIKYDMHMGYKIKESGRVFEDVAGRTDVEDAFGIYFIMLSPLSRKIRVKNKVVKGVSQIFQGTFEGITSEELKQLHLEADMKKGGSR